MNSATQKVVLILYDSKLLRWNLFLRPNYTVHYHHGVILKTAHKKYGDTCRNDNTIMYASHGLLTPIHIPHSTNIHSTCSHYAIGVSLKSTTTHLEISTTSELTNMIGHQLHTYVKTPLLFNQDPSKML